MTPPFLRSLGRPHGGDLASTSSRVGEIRLSPQLTRLSELVSRSRDLASDRGRESLAQILPNCAGNPNCSPDLSLLPAAIEQGAAAARGNPALYRMVLNFLAAQLLSTTNLEEQTAIRNRAREIARQALTAISDPGFSPEAEDPEHLDEPVRTKTRMLFDISCTLSALLAQPTSEGYSEADRALLGDYFHQMLSGMEQTRVRSAINPNNPPFPEYFERFVRAQAAILENDREGAFRQLLATRALFQEMEPERRGRPLPQLVETSAEMTLQSMPRDAAGEHVENLRTLLSLEALGYFYQVDFAESHAESELPVSQRRNQALNLVAGVYLNAGLSAANASELVDRLNDLGESRAPLLQAMERRYSTDHAFQEAVGRLYTGNLGDTSRRRAIFEEMLGDAQTTARHLRSHRNEQPYQTVFSRDREGRNLGRSIEALRGNEVLIANLRTGLGLGENAGAEAISRQLSEMGPLLPIFLQSLPELVRNDDHNRSFFDSIRAAAQGYRGDGMRSNVEGPLVDMVESLNELARG
ncbi:MAG: hypothetical protein K8R69_03700, partial [Deltaproteobacteria bacterium]|nr:hypothetical protein [Deltaproteobacteria bacterium]